MGIRWRHALARFLLPGEADCRLSIRTHQGHGCGSNQRSLNMMPLSIAGMGFAAVLGIAALAPCRAQTPQTFDSDLSISGE